MRQAVRAACQDCQMVIAGKIRCEQCNGFESDSAKNEGLASCEGCQTSACSSCFDKNTCDSCGEIHCANCFDGYYCPACDKACWSDCAPMGKITCHQCGTKCCFNCMLGDWFFCDVCSAEYTAGIVVICTSTFAVDVVSKNSVRTTKSARFVQRHLLAPAVL